MSFVTLLRSILGRMPIVRRYAANPTGGVSMIFAISSLTLFMIVGFVVDMGRYYVARNRIEHSLDAAGLAVGSSTSGYTAAQGTCDYINTDYLPSIADKYFNANYVSTIGTATATGVSTDTPSPVKVCQSTNGNTLVLSSVVTVKTTFLAIAGFTQLSSVVYSKITRATSGLEMTLIVDNTGSMAQTTTDGVVALLALKQASYNLINTLWGLPTTGAASGVAASGNPAPAPGLYVSIVPFVAQVNALNTNTLSVNGSAVTSPSELLGNDANKRLSDILNVNPAVNSPTNPLCGYNGTWLPDATDFVAPMDLIHLAQDLCAQYISTTLKSTSTGQQQFTASYQNLYLVDALNPSSTRGMAWAGCVEGRLSKGDTSATPYRDYNTISPPDSEYDLELTDAQSGTVNGTTPKSADFLWSIYRGTVASTAGAPSTDARNLSYLPNAAVPNVSGKIISKYYAAPTTTVTKSGSTYTQTTTYNDPLIIQFTQTCTASGSVVGTPGTCKAPYSNPKYTATGGYNYYWAKPIASSGGTLDDTGLNGFCTNQEILPLTNNYADVATEIGPSNSETVGMTDNSFTGTVADFAWAWGQRVLSGQAPFAESTAIEASTTTGTAGWRKAVVFMTDGNMNFVPSQTYTNYSTVGSNTDPWHVTATLSGDPPLAAIENNSGPTNSVVATLANNDPNFPNWTSAPSQQCAYQNNSNGTTADAYQIMCRIYYVCQSMRASNYFIYTLLFSHDATDSPSSDEGLLMQQCTADGAGNVDATKFFNVSNSSSLSAAFASIGSQLQQLRVSQ